MSRKKIGLRVKIDQKESFRYKFISDTILKLSEGKRNIIELVLCEHIGRSVNEIDIIHCLLVSKLYIFNEESLLYNGIEIGTLKTEYGHDEDDFVRNEFTFLFTFTPVKTVTHGT